MDIIKLLSQVDLDSQMSTIYKLKDIGAGISGELFEVVVCYALERAAPDAKIIHVGKVIPEYLKGVIDPKTDILISVPKENRPMEHHNYPISLKTSTKETKLYQGTTQDIFGVYPLENLRRVIKGTPMRELGYLVLNKLGNCPILSTEFTDDTWSIQLKNFDRAASKLTDGDFEIKWNSKSLGLIFDEGRITVTTDGRILANNKFFNVIDSVSGDLKPIDPQSLMRGVLDYIDEQV